MTIEWLTWPAPDNVKACYSLRTGGASSPPYDSLNLGEHVQDDPVLVQQNREYLKSVSGCSNISWLRQVHGTRVVQLPLQLSLQEAQDIESDASYTNVPGHTCCVMTADCLPVFFCDQEGTQIAIAHAGWRGLLEGVLEKTVSVFSEPSKILAYMGPAISQQAFEVGNEVRDAFIAKDQQLIDFFIPSNKSDHWMADLYGMAEYTLKQLGVSDVYGGQCCTFTEKDRFFSYRRDGVTGRMANLIWLE